MALQSTFYTKECPVSNGGIILHLLKIMSQWKEQTLTVP